MKLKKFHFSSLNTYGIFELIVHQASYQYDQRSI